MFLLISGSCGLVYEILWMKMLTLVIGNTVFSTTTVLTAFMGGLALGSFLAGRFIDKIKDPLRTYGILEGGIGAYALLVPLFIAGTEPLFRIIYQGINPSFYAFSLLRFFVCGIILLVFTTLMGATLPVLSKYFVEKQTHVGWNVGMLYGVNTFGAVLGSFLAGFVLIPALGVTWTIYLAALLNVSIAVGVLKLAKNRVRWEPSETKGKSKDKKRKKRAEEESGRSRSGELGRQTMGCHSTYRPVRHCGHDLSDCLDKGAVALDRLFGLCIQPDCHGLYLRPGVRKSHHL
jgi:spermidine synthase